MITKKNKKIKSQPGIFSRPARIAVRPKSRRRFSAVAVANKKNRSKTGLYRMLILVLLALAALFLIFSAWKVYNKRQSQKQRLEELKSEAGKLAGESLDLKSEISQFEDNEKLEEMARERLGLKKPGEEVVVIVPTEKTVEPLAKENRNWWQKLLEKIGINR